MKQSVCFLLLVLLTTKSVAQPSDAQIKKDMTNAGTLSVKFTSSTGTRAFNTDTKNYEYSRGVEIKRKSEYPGVNVIVKGSAVYQYTGVGKYSYWKFRVLSNEYEGIPNPKEKEILSFIEKDMQTFYGDYYYGSITEVLEPPKLAADPNWYWHSPKSVSFRMVVKHKIKSSVNTLNVDLTEQLYEVRLYRDDMKGEWKSFFSQFVQSPGGTKVISSETLTREKIEKLSTLKDRAAADAKKAIIAAGGNLKIPDDGSFEDLVMFIHKLLRDGTPEQVRAVMIQVLAPNVRDVDGVINRMIDHAFKHDLKYKDVFCVKPPINKGLSDKSNVSFLGNMPNTNTVFSGSEVSEGYVEGKPITKWKIYRADVNMRFDDDAVKYFNSFSDKKKLCPND